MLLLFVTIKKVGAITLCINSLMSNFPKHSLPPPLSLKSEIDFIFYVDLVSHMDPSKHLQCVVEQTLRLFGEQILPV